MTAGGGTISGVAAADVDADAAFDDPRRDDNAAPVCGDPPLAAPEVEPACA